MTKFIYIADTHWGAGASGYQMQQRYPKKLPDILLGLDQWIAESGGVDFVLHGGDMVDSCSDETIAGARELFSLSVPVYLCLGNHDLTESDGVERWLSQAPGFFGAGSVDFTIKTADCVLHIAPNQWGPSPYHWKNEQNPLFLDSQIKRVETALQTRMDAVHMLATHSPVYDVPKEQRGSEEAFHLPPAHFTSQVEGVCAGTPLRVVLGAHSHTNMRVEEEGVHFVTVSSLIETPFEFKLFVIEDRAVSMETVNLFDRIDFRAVYDFDRTFVQGRKCDRSFSL